MKLTQLLKEITRSPLSKKEILDIFVKEDILATILWNLDDSDRNDIDGWINSEFGDDDDFFSDKSMASLAIEQYFKLFKPGELKIVSLCDMTTLNIGDYKFICKYNGNDSGGDSLIFYNDPNFFQE